jgi:eukaryotic-like serine/threonine-protein kinase
MAARPCGPKQKNELLREGRGAVFSHKRFNATQAARRVAMSLPTELEDIFLTALEKGTAAERTAWLDDACRGQTDLRQEVERLLAAHPQVGDFLQSPPTAIANLADTARETQATGTPTLGFLSPSQRPGSLGRLRHYEILEVVGTGGFGVVLKAHDEKLHRVVAIKTLAESLAASATARKRFVREAQAAAAVRHDNVVGIYAVEEEGPVPYLVMELVDGISLEERLKQDGPLELKEVLRIGVQVAAGLAAAHRQGLVHRDVKPANILLENSVQRVKITDFGLARAVDDASLTGTGLIAGTPSYMSPEQARGDFVDHRSDLFSLGSVLYAMCTGHAPFRGSTTLGVVKRVCEEQAQPIREHHPEIPDWLCALVTKLHAKDPAERFQSAQEVADLLQHHLAQVQHPSVALPAGDKPVALPWIARRRLWTTATAALLCFIAGLGLTETGGVTHFAASAHRAITGKGTPDNQSHDPAAKVAPDGQARNEPVNAAQKALPHAAEMASPHVATELRRFDGHEAIVWSVAFSADGSRALSGSGGRLKEGRWTHGSDFTVRLWDVASARQLHCFAGHQHHVQSVAFTRDDRQVVGAGKIWAWRRWDVETGQELPGFSGDPGKPFFHLALSADAARLLSWGGKDKVLRLWDVTTGTELWKFEGLAEEVSAAAFSADGRRVATAGGGKYEQTNQQLKPGSDYSIRLWNAVSGKEELRLRGHYSFVRGLAFLPDGRRLLSGGADNLLRLWDLQSGEELHIYPGHARPVNTIALSRDGRWVLSGSADTTVRLWEIETAKELCRYLGHTGEVCSVSFSPDRRYALSGGCDETVRLWQLPELEK